MHATPPMREHELDELLSAPTPGVVDALSRVQGDIVILGGGGKVGPTMARMARRALDEARSSSRVISVSRWSDKEAERRLNEHGIETVSADLGDPDAWATLPDAGAVMYLLGHKFGATANPSITWWINAVVPGFCAARYRGVPTVAYSTGNVYPLRPLALGGATERDELGPVGMYAQSCAAREQAFAQGAERFGTPTTIYRLNYACELRYGVVADIAQTIAAGDPVDVTMPAVNIVWQRDSNAWSWQALDLADSPAAILNGTGPETLSTRHIAEQLALLGGWDLTITGDEAPTALLSNAEKCHSLYGYPSVSAATIIEWVAQWVRSGGRMLGKPTKFQQRDGGF